MVDKIAKTDPQDEIKFAYKLLCQSVNSKTIGLQELRKINAKLHVELTNQEMRAMIAEFDADGDGQSKNYH